MTIDINPENVPQHLRYLIPYIDKWRLQIEGEAQWDKLPIEDVTSFYEIFSLAWGAISRFLYADVKSVKPETEEHEIFQAVLRALDDAGAVLIREKPEKWLEIEGYPEKWPGVKFDPNQLPAQLHPLIPYAERLLVEDQGIRDVVMLVQSNASLEEFIAVANQIGIEEIRRIGLDMACSDNLDTQSVGDALLLLLGLVGTAESLLRSRKP